MLTKIMKWLSIATLLPAILWQPSAGYELTVQFVVCTGAAVVALQAFRSKRQIWGIGFAAIAMVFNPFQPLGFSRSAFLFWGWVSAATFLASLVVLKARPGLGMQGITGQSPGDHGLW